MIATALLDRALEYAGGSHTLADVDAGIQEGRFQEWTGDASVIVTEIRETPQQKILLFWLASGELEELRAMALPICEWGKSVGCVKAQLVGRLGWQRSAILKDGWKVTSVLMEREL